MTTLGPREGALALAAVAALLAACGGSQPCGAASCASDAGGAADLATSPDLAPACRDDGYDCKSDGECCGNVCGGTFCASSDSTCAAYSWGTPAIQDACCAKRHPAGVATWQQLTHDCDCQTCAVSCANTLCAPTPSPADPSCTQCLVHAGCATAAAQECSDDPECDAYLTCSRAPG